MNGCLITTRKVGDDDYFYHPLSYLFIIGCNKLYIACATFYNRQNPEIVPGNRSQTSTIQGFLLVKSCRRVVSYSFSCYIFLQFFLLYISRCYHGYQKYLYKYICVSGVHHDNPLANESSLLTVVSWTMTPLPLHGIIYYMKSSNVLLLTSSIYQSKQTNLKKTNYRELHQTQ